MPVKFTDNSAQTLAELSVLERAALEAVGGQAVSHAKQNITLASRVDTGALRNSVSHTVKGDKCYVGTNISYAIFNEMGTGIYIAGGRKTPWSYKDGKGNWHKTRGMPPIHFLKNAIANHINEFKGIIINILKG